MNQVALYWPNDDHAHFRYHSFEYFATNHFTPCMETYTRIWQQKQENPILNLPKWIPYTVLPISLFFIIIRLMEENIKIIKGIKAGEYDKKPEEGKEE